MISRVSLSCYGAAIPGFRVGLVHLSPDQQAPPEIVNMDDKYGPVTTLKSCSTLDYFAYQKTPHIIRAHSKSDARLRRLQPSSPS